MKLLQQETIELQGNPVSRANEDEVAQFHRRLSEVAQLKRQRTGGKKKSSIITSSKSSAFEDSRITRLYFERYRVIELGRMWLIFATIILMILQVKIFGQMKYEVSFANQLTDIYEKEITTLLYLIMILTIITILMTFIAYLAEFEFKKRSLSIPQDSNIFQTNLIFLLLIEVAFLLPCPTPYTTNYKVYFNQRYSEQSRFYFLNEILIYITLFRSLLILNIAFKFQDFYSNRVNRLCQIYSVEFGPHFIFKVAIREHPYSTLCGLFCMGLFLFSYQLEISERALKRTSQEIEYYNINNSIWICMITIFTVGYGDMYPTTELGRLAMTLGLFYGVALTSLFTAILYADLQPLTSELQSLTLLEKAIIKINYRKTAQEIFLRIFKLSNIKKNTQNINFSEQEINTQIKSIDSNIRECVILKTTYRTMNSEDIKALQERCFQDMQNRVKEFKDMLNQMKHQQKHREIADTPKLRSVQKQCNTITAASGDVKSKSKDDLYFEQLIDSESDDQNLMQFKEDE